MQRCRIQDIAMPIRNPLIRRSFSSCLAILGPFLVVAAGCGGGGLPESAGAGAGDAAAASVFQVPDGMTVHLARDRTPLVDLVMHDLDGRSVSLPELRGKVVLVNFWATWCGPCRAEIPDLMALRDQYPDQLEVIGVSLDEGGPGVVRAFVDELEMNYPVVMTTPQIANHFPGVFALPTTFVLDPNGAVAQRHVGLVNAAVIEQEMKHLVGLPTPVVAELVDDIGSRYLIDAAQATEIPGIDLSVLTVAQKENALQRLNAEHCTCGCQLTLAGCRINDPACDVSLPLAQQVVDEIVS